MRDDVAYDRTYTEVFDEITYTIEGYQYDYPIPNILLEEVVLGKENVRCMSRNRAKADMMKVNSKSLQKPQRIIQKII